MPGVDERFSRNALGLSRNDIRILSVFLTGRNTVNRHLALLRKKSDALYPICAKEPDSSFQFFGRFMWIDEGITLEVSSSQTM